MKSVDAVGAWGWKLALIWWALTVDAVAAQPVPTQFAERWIVILASHKSVDAARRAAALRAPPAVVLASDVFSGLSPGYSLVVLGPFSDRTQAQAARDKSGVKRAYVRFTGATRDAVATDPPSAAKVASPAAPKQPCESHRCWSHQSLSKPQIAALEAWEETERHRPGRSGFDILDVIEPQSGTLGAILVNERQREGNRCEEGYREVEFATEPRGMRVVNVRLVGHGCCDGTNCERRTPAAFMLDLLNGSDTRWAFSAKQGVEVADIDGTLKRVKRADAPDELGGMLSFDPEYDSIRCPDTWQKGSAVCAKGRGGEGYAFTWRQTANSAVLESIVVTNME